MTGLNGPLVVVLYERVVGHLDRGPQGPAFTYSQESGHVPLSVNLPRAPGRSFPSRKVAPFVDGLLPENADVRRRIAADLGVADHPQQLLAVTGWDCPGAVQLTDEDRLSAMLSRDGSLMALRESDIAARLDRLQDPEASWTEPGEHWSLAGQQSKFALARTPSGWAEAKGAEPTTHIVKPGIGRLAHQALVEHATMRAAAALGVEVAGTEYAEFDGRPAIVVERFDRIRQRDGKVARIHQEDMCQACGRMPNHKYEDAGGPNLREMAAVLRANARKPGPEIAKLADFLLVNYAAEAPDGHSKNVSIRILPSGNVTMAPLYDLASALPYELRSLDRNLALAIGGRRRLNDIHAKQWARAAQDLGLPEDQLRDRARHLVSGFPDAFRDALHATGAPAATEVWARTSARASAHAERGLKRLKEADRSPASRNTP